MQKKQQFAFSAINFYLLAVAIVTVLIGFVLMSGKGATGDQFDASIFNNTRTVVAPLVCFVGYLFMIVAILYRPKEKTSDEAHNNVQDANNDESSKVEVLTTLHVDAPLEANSCARPTSEV